MTASPTSPAGIPKPTDDPVHEAVARWVAAGHDDPAATVAAVVATVAEASGSTVALEIDGVPVEPDPAVRAADVAPGLLRRAGPWLPGFVREAVTTPAERRRQGVHHTAPDVAATLVRLTADARPLAPGEVVADPAVGGGAFLLAALEAMPGPRAARLARVRGCDLDPLAVATTVAALRLWAGGPAPAPDAIRVGNGLDPDPVDPPPAWVIGNPPFRSQLRRRTSRSGERRVELRRRWPELGGYVDDAAAFVLAALDTVAPGGAIALVQPASFLSARDAAPVRARLAATAPPAAVWTDDARRFAADVDTVACVLVAGRPAGDVRRVRGVPPLDEDSGPLPSAASWAPLLARPGPPPVRVRAPSAPVRIGDVATVSSGFRDHFYGLRDAVVDDPDGDHPLVTSGLIDPLVLRWGSVPARFDHRRWSAPTVRLARVDAGVRGWLAERLVPKVLVASQTRIVEAVLDPTGAAVPCTPVITVIPRPGGPSAAHLAAALTSPVASAELVRRSAGSGLSPDAVRVAAPRVAELPLPRPGPAWDRAAELVAAGGDRAAVAEVGDLLMAAYGVAPSDREALRAWWRNRLPRR